MNSLKLILLMCFACLLLGVVPSYGSSKPQCGNFLKLLSKQPKDLVFLECKNGYSAQIKVLRARYRVSGVYAASVENYFVQHTGMQKLVFLCCGWETVPNQAGNRYGYLKSQFEFDYEIDMGSGETVYNQRTAWNKIPWFYLTVQLPLESP
jgi:Domian of unknown function (DUF4952)